MDLAITLIDSRCVPFHHQRTKNPATQVREPSLATSASQLFYPMEEHKFGKVTGIRHIVRLRELLHKWQSVALISKRNNSNSSNNDNDSPLAHHGHVRFDADVEEGCSTPEPPPDVPKGYLAVYVGPENRRFIIPTTYLTHNLFKILLEKTEEEYGFDHAGALTIPCEIETFKYLLKCIETHPPEDPEAL